MIGFVLFGFGWALAGGVVGWLLRGMAAREPQREPVVYVDTSMFQASRERDRRGS